MEDVEPRSIYRPNALNCLHAPSPAAVNPLVKVCWTVIVLFIASCGASLPLAAASQAEQLFHQAQKAERDGEIVKAYILYAEAAAADPSNIDYWSRAQALRPAASLKDASPPEPPGFPSDKIDRTLFKTITEEELEETRKLLPPPKLQVALGRRDYDFQGDSKALWEQMAAALNLKVLFDGDYRPTRAFRFELADADYRAALQSLQLATNSFLVPVSPRLIFVANDSTQKRRDFEPTVAVTVPFAEGTTVQALQELGTVIRGVLDAQKVSVDPTRRLILIRDKVAKVRLAEKLMSDLMRPHAQVIVDVEILTTDLSSSLSYGLSLPTSFPIASFVKRANLINYIPSGFSTFLSFGGGASLLGLGVTNAQLFATVSNSNSQSIYRGQVVAVEGLPSTLHVGEKYPIVTSGYFGNTSGSGTVYTPPPTISFEDLGLSIKVTPHIVSDDEVALDLDAEFKLLGGSSSNGIPVVLNTQYQSKVNVMAGEWAVLSGLMTSQEAKTITGIPLLSYIPLLRQTIVTKDRGMTLIVLKPHVTIAPPSATSAWRAWSGSETRNPPDL